MMQKPYGPFTLTAGCHVEDEPVGEIVVKEFGNGQLFTQDGRRLTIDRGAYLLVNGQPLSCHVKGRKTDPDGYTRVAPPDLNVGESVVLCKEVIYDRSSQPFMSVQELDKNFNSRGSIQYERRHAQADLDELAALRREVQMLREGKAQVQADPVLAELEKAKRELAELRGRQMQANADRASLNTNVEAVLDKNPSMPDLDRMSVKQLQDLAADEEIDLGKMTDKNQIVKAIRQAKQLQPA